MASFDVPETGFVLNGAPSLPNGGSKSSSKDVRALCINLPKGLLKELLKARSKNGQVAEICFGKDKSIEYSGKARDVTARQSDHRSELYQRSSSNNEALSFRSLVNHRLAVRNTERTVSTADLAVLKLQRELREHEEVKRLNTTRIADKSELPPALSGRKALAAKSRKANPLLKPARKHLTPNLTRSMPSSPSLGATPSPYIHPSRPPTSTPTLESPKTAKLKALRVPVLHLLALRPISEKEIQRQTHSSTEDCSELVKKFSKTSRDGTGLVLSDRWYKDLDVWKFPYSSEDRQTAINNSISAFDRLRLSKEDKEWELLLPKSQRGKGKGRELSRLNLNNGPLPAIRVSHTKPSPKTAIKRAASPAPNDNGRGRAAEKSEPSTTSSTLGVKREPARSHSQPPVKKQKIGEREAESKRLLAKPIKKVEKPAAKGRGAVSGKQNSKVKSSEYVVDSSEEEGQSEKASAHKRAESAKPKPKAPAPKTQKTTSEPSSLKRKAHADPDQPNKKPASKLNMVQSSPSVSSNQKAPAKSLPPPANRPRHNSSPNKPSPLGSSPPTNASDFESDHHYNAASSSSSSPLINEIKRTLPITTAPKHAVRTEKAMAVIQKHVIDSAKSSAQDRERHSVNRHRQMPSNGSTSASSPTEDTTLRLAQKFKAGYLKYEKLHRELSASSSPAAERVEELRRWNKRLATMKQQIEQAVMTA